MSSILLFDTLRLSSELNLSKLGIALSWLLLRSKCASLNGTYENSRFLNRLCDRLSETRCIRFQSLSKDFNLLCDRFK